MTTFRATKSLLFSQVSCETGWDVCGTLGSKVETSRIASPYFITVSFTAEKVSHPPPQCKPNCHLRWEQRPKCRGSRWMSRQIEVLQYTGINWRAYESLL